ncbi:hypothetical protein ACYSNW_01400 [Enterococcus sp. LJL99]
MTKINPKFLKAIVKQECRVYKNSERYKNLEKRFGPSEKETVKILSVYDNIQQKLLELEIQKLRKEKSLDEIINLLASSLRDIRFFEAELFNLLKSDNKEDGIMNSFYGMVSNENIDLFEMIENELYQVSNS